MNGSTDEQTSAERSAFEDDPVAPVSFPVALGGAAAVLALLGGWAAWPAAIPTSAGLAPVHAAAAVLALATFAARGLDRLDRRVGSALAVAAGLALVAHATMAVVGYAATRAIPAGPPLGAVGGFLVAVAGGLDRQHLPQRDLVLKGRDVVVVVLGGVVGYAAITVAALMLAVPVLVATGGLTDMQTTVIGSVGNGLGLVALTLLVLSTADRDRSFLDLRWPTRRDVAWMLGGSLLLLGGLYGLSALFAELGVQSAEHGLAEQAREGNAAILLALVPLSYLFVGPGEELFFRNLVQKYLYERFSRPAAILLASSVFAGVHFSAYSGRFTLATVTSLTVVFLLALGLGVIYERTDSVVVPAFVHGTFNAVQFLVLYVSVA
jgi:membrane protease YdiL (CAAX protease family)